ncbi:hypothetical protein BLNAU_3308 [Blattamonas nauphoetae]|uniref:Protein kinase domain-containing protein n=1 Tax=Blattamonas nauphoetae TaxID=2049346 RepID=A0ABQ9YDN0_9EUKA|nr:hypothetical protein BLNAU_3308 [Blattamonas nauphoetae]
MAAPLLILSIFVVQSSSYRPVVPFKPRSLDEELTHSFNSNENRNERPRRIVLDHDSYIGKDLSIPELTLDIRGRSTLIVHPDPIRTGQNVDLGFPKLTHPPQLSPIFVLSNSTMSRSTLSISAVLPNSIICSLSSSVQFVSNCRITSNGRQCPFVAVDGQTTESTSITMLNVSRQIPNTFSLLPLISSQMGLNDLQDHLHSSSPLTILGIGLLMSHTILPRSTGPLFDFGAPSQIVKQLNLDLTVTLSTSIFENMTTHSQPPRREHHPRLAQTVVATSAHRSFSRPLRPPHPIKTQIFMNINIINPLIVDCLSGNEVRMRDCLVIEYQHVQPERGPCEAMIFFHAPCLLVEGMQHLMLSCASTIHDCHGNTFRDNPWNNELSVIDCSFFNPFRSLGTTDRWDSSSGLHLSVVFVIVWRRRESKKEEGEEMENAGRVEMDEKMEVTVTDHHVSTNPNNSMINSQPNEAATKEEDVYSDELVDIVDEIEAVACGVGIEVVIVKKERTLCNRLHSEEKGGIVKRSVQGQIVRRLKMLSKKNRNAPIFLSLTSHNIVFDSTGRVCFKTSADIVQPSLNALEPQIACPPGVEFEDKAMEERALKKKDAMSEAQRWLAPEMIEEKENIDGTKAAVFSLGLLLWEVETGQVPFGEQDGVNACRQIVAGTLPPMDGIVLDSLKELIADCMALDPKKRPTLDEVASCLDSLPADADDSPPDAPMRT